MLRGWGGSRLLESYGIERQPVGERNVDASAHNYFALKSVEDASDLLADSERGAAQRAQVGAAIAKATHTEWETLGIHLGYRYEHSPHLRPGRHVRAARPSALLHAHHPAGASRAARMAG